MSRISKMARRVMCATALTAATAGMATVSSSGSAHADAWSATLTIMQYSPYNYWSPSKATSR